jgi:hypothetical protein
VKEVCDFAAEITWEKRKILLEIRTLKGTLLSWSQMQALVTTSAKSFSVFPLSKTSPLTGKFISFDTFIPLFGTDLARGIFLVGAFSTGKGTDK